MPARARRSPPGRSNDSCTPRASSTRRLLASRRVTKMSCARSARRAARRARRAAPLVGGLRLRQRHSGRTSRKAFRLRCRSMRASSSFASSTRETSLRSSSRPSSATPAWARIRHRLLPIRRRARHEGTGRRPPAAQFIMFRSRVSVSGTRSRAAAGGRRAGAPSAPRRRCRFSASSRSSRDVVQLRQPCRAIVVRNLDARQVRDAGDVVFGQGPWRSGQRLAAIAMHSGRARNLHATPARTRRRPAPQAGVLSRT